MSDLIKPDSYTLETVKNHLIRNFLRNGRVRVKFVVFFKNWIIRKPLNFPWLIKLLSGDPSVWLKSLFFYEVISNFKPLARGKFY